MQRQYSRVANNQKSVSSSNNCKIAKGKKPLINFKFYLDLEKYNVSSNIETKIKELGGSVEIFLSQQITHLITDKTDTSPLGGSVSVATKLNRSKQFSAAASSSSLSPHHARNTQTESTANNSRANEMLQRARSQSNGRVNNKQKPLELAKVWGTAIWTVEYALRFLKKVKATVAQQTAASGSTTVKLHKLNTARRSQSNSARRKTLNGEFIKIEAFQTGYRPFYAELKVWPTISLHTLDGCSPFSKPTPTPLPTPARPQNLVNTKKHAEELHLTNKKTNDNESLEISYNNRSSSTTRMTRKTRTRQIRVKNDTKKLSDQKSPTTTTPTVGAVETVAATERVPIPTANTTKTTSPQLVASIAVVSKSQQPPAQQQCGGGYCELCRVEYDILNVHIQSKDHKTYAKNQDNFITLDSLISSSTAVNNFIKINASCPVFGKRTIKKPSKYLQETNAKGGKDSTPTSPTTTTTPPSNNCSPRKTNNSGSGEVRRTLTVDLKRLPMPYNSKTSPIKVTSSRKNSEELLLLDGPQLRSKRETCRRINYTESKDDEDVGGCKSKIKIRGIQWRAPSPEQRANLPPPLLYKVIDKTKSCAKNVEAVTSTTTAITTMTTIRKVDTTRSPRIATLSPYFTDKPSATQSESNAPKNGIVVKFKRVRQSELSLLSDEAENFMFPKREQSECDTDEDRQSTSEPTEQLSEPVVTSSETNYTLTKSSKSVATKQHRNTITPITGNSCRNRKRKTNLEAFLDDNTEYYKFESPNSRLRFQDAPIQSSTTSVITTADAKSKSVSTELEQKQTGSECVNDDGETTEDRVGAWQWINGKFIFTNAEVDRHKFAFERVPATEPWFDAFRRQDDGKEQIFQYFGSTDYHKLPYEMGPLPPLSSDCCVLYKPPSEAKVKPKKSVVQARAPPLNSRKAAAMAAMSTASLPSPPTSATKRSPNAKRKMSRKRKLMLEANHPRKSPREHASTLAILSCLVKRQNGMQSTSSAGADVSQQSELDTSQLSTIVEEQMYTTPAQLSSKIDAFLSDLPSPAADDDDDENDVSYLTDCVRADECAPISRSVHTDFVDLIANSVHSRTAGGTEIDPVDRMMAGELPPRKMNRIEALALARIKKRSINKTGWPTIQKRRMAIKREKDGCCSSTTAIADDSTPASATNEEELPGTCSPEPDESMQQCNMDLSIVKIEADAVNELPPADDKLLSNGGDVILFNVSSDSLDTILTDDEEAEEGEEEEEEDDEDGEDGEDDDDDNDDDEDDDDEETLKYDEQPATVPLALDEEEDDRTTQIKESEEYYHVEELESSSDNGVDLKCSLSSKSKCFEDEEEAEAVAEEQQLLDEVDDDMNDEEETEVLELSEDNMYNNHVMMVRGGECEMPNRIKKSYKLRKGRNVTPPDKSSASSTALVVKNHRGGNNQVNNNVISTSAAAAAVVAVVSPRKLRKPRGRWYRER